MGMFKGLGTLVAGIGAIVLVLTILGFGIKTPAAALTEFKVDHAVEHAAIEDTLGEITAGLRSQQELLEAIARGECIENPLEDLQRQGLIDKCQELGIER